MTTATLSRLEEHPHAALIPAMSDAEYRELVDDIRANGLLEPVTLHEGKVLDGRHRARACAELGIEPAYREYEGEEPAAFVLSLNVKRRNLTVSQRAAIAVECLPRLEVEARARQAHGSTAPGRNAWDHVIPSVTARNPKARETAGDLVGVSGASVDRAKRVQREAPEDFERVKAGEITVRSADCRLHERNGNGRATPAAVVAAAPVEITTTRDRQIAEKARERVEKAVGTCNGQARGLGELKLDRACLVATREEIQGWDDAFREAIAALGQLRKRLKEASPQ